MDGMCHEITAVGGQKAIGIPCIDWQVDEPVTIPIRREPFIILPPPRPMTGRGPYRCGREFFSREFGRRLELHSARSNIC